MKRNYTITYAHHTSVYKQLTVKGTLEQARRFAAAYAAKAHLMGVTASIREVTA